jgi:carboxyl-terminal processing protease
MHQRTWLTLLTLPLVVAFTVPMFHRQAPKPIKAEPVASGASDPLAGLADIQDVIAHIRANYVDVPDMEKAMAGGIQGALERANLLNSYLTPAETMLPDPGAGETGLTLLKTQLYAVVIGVAPGSPASKAGIQVGDRVRKLDGESMGPMSHWAMERKLRGPVGSEITVYRMPQGTSDPKKVALKREKPVRPSIESRSEPKALMVALPDLAEGRAKELLGIFKAADKRRPLVVDLRTCIGGTYEEAAKVASMLGCRGVFAIVQEAGEPDRQIAAAQSEAVDFPKIAILTGLGTIGPAETLAVALRCLGDGGAETPNGAKTVVTLGERTIGQAVERRRFPLKHGGAVELVTRRWMGPKGEALDKPGPAPDYTLRGVPDDEELLPRILEALEKGPVLPLEKSQSVALLVPSTYALV